jgi:hypothetical protein
MSSTNKNWFRPVIAALSLVAALTETTAVWAQNFGPDPFRPYNSQYDAYTYPMGPATPGAGGNAVMNPPGFRGANQYQDFLNDMQGPSFQNGARYGIGQPYYQSTVDPKFAGQYRREYQPRVKAEKSFEDTQRLINDKYFAYLEEKDPKKRARLLRDYQLAQKLATRALSTRRTDPASILESAKRRDSLLESQKPDRASSSRSGPGTAPRIPSSILDRSRASDARSIPAAPSLSIGSSPRTGTRTTPTDILNRARSLETPKNSQSKPATKGANDSRTRSRPAPPSLSP